MNGNTPYAGIAGITQAGKRAAADEPELSTTQKRAIREELSSIAAATRRFLPDEYVVDAGLRSGVAGLQATVAVQPPIGSPISADFQPDAADLEDGTIPVEDRDELARSLAAGAALEVKSALQDSVTPTAR